MEPDSKIHNQEPGRAPGFQANTGRREHMSRGGQDQDGEIYIDN